MNIKEKELSHVNKEGQAAMVDVGEKKVTKRMASARAIVVLPQEVMSLLKDGELWGKKGPVIQTAIIAGTMGAKRTGELIPMCHPLGLESCSFDTEWKGNELIIQCTTKIESKTGVEMEALTGASVAALTVYDMCKALSHDIVIKEIKLLEKRGGKSDFKREA
ncbi:MAG: cyclic pyranopterin monophosphate synthase MoaC [Imperialibacter sp.]|uniref:cyclic pyranopterin monophosphate synthase MoaC n=1 Tax=Imperialibacter sp. TaxID=2038411 RepID=UPI0032EE4E25